MVQSVTEFSQSHPDAEMDVIGMLVALGIAVLLLPVLPFLAVLWVVGRVSEMSGGHPSSGPASLRAFEREREHERERES